MRINRVLVALLLASCSGSTTGSLPLGDAPDGGAGRANAREAGLTNTGGAGTTSTGGSTTSTTGGASSSCATGTEGCACYGNGTCNATLTCASHLCVSLGSGGTSGSGGATGGVGNPSTGGTLINTGGTTSTGGAVIDTGGAPTGGVPTGGVPTGGVPTGGVPTGGVPSTGGAIGTGGAPQCSPVNSLCAASDECCLGLICATEPGRTNGVCTSSCVNDFGCSTGCCAPVADQSGSVCAPAGYCSGSCLPEYDSCTSFPSDCCAGTTCLYDDPSETTASCQFICTTDSQCELGCCAPIQGKSYSACANPVYCGGSCLPAGTRPCGLGVDCCPGSYCISDAINQICLPVCFAHSECASGCCAAPNGNGVYVCTDPGYCGFSGSGGASGAGGATSTGGAPGSGGTTATGGTPGSGGTGGAPSDPVVPAITETCPTFTNSTVTFMGLGGIQIVAGTKPPGKTAPMVFYWHGTNSSAGEFATLATAVRDGVVQEGGVLVSFQGTTGGDLLSGTSIFGAGDFNLTDQLFACAVKDHNVDPRRVFTTGCSAGGLFATAMAARRSSYIAAAAPNSGGWLASVAWQTNYTPALMTVHGAPGTDVVVVDFSNTSATADTAFKQHGGFVIDCNTNGGHCGGSGLAPDIWTFFEAHPYGVAPEPWSALPQGFSNLCSIK